MKRLTRTKNSVVKIQNSVVNHESQLVKSNPDIAEKILKYYMKKDANGISKLKLFKIIGVYHKRKVLNTI